MHSQMGNDKMPGRDGARPAGATGTFRDDDRNSMWAAAPRALGADAILSYTPRMIKPLPLIAGILGVVFLALAAFYWLTPAGSLPAFLPGFEAGSDHVHFKHGLGALILALALFAFAWFQSAPERR
jgi:hypothetical protein